MVELLTRNPDGDISEAALRNPACGAVVLSRAALCQRPVPTQSRRDEPYERTAAADASSRGLLTVVCVAPLSKTRQLPAGGAHHQRRPARLPYTHIHSPESELPAADAGCAGRGSRPARASSSSRQRIHTAAARRTDHQRPRPRYRCPQRRPAPRAGAVDVPSTHSAQPELPRMAAAPVCLRHRQRQRRNPHAGSPPQQLPAVDSGSSRRRPDASCGGTHRHQKHSQRSPLSV